MTETAFQQRFVRLRSRPSGDWVVDPELRPKLVAEAQEKGTNLTEVIIGILARQYGVAFEPAGRKTEPHIDGDEFNLRLPVELDRKIAAAAGASGRSPQREILASLSAHFGWRLPEPAPRGRRNGARTAAA